MSEKGSARTPSEKSIHVEELSMKGDHDHDAQRLQELGYKQEFKREINMFVQCGFGFAIMAVLPNWLVGFGSSMQAGGPSSLFWSWIVLSPFVMCIASSMAEVISHFPLTGGIYSWCYQLSNEEWGPFMSWLSAYMNIAGLLTTQMTLAYSCAQFIYGIVELNTGVTITSQGAYVGLYCAMLVIATVFAFFGLKFNGYVNYFIVVWVLVGTILVSVMVPAMAPTHRDAKWVFTAFINQTGYENKGMAFLMGLLQAGWCLIGYGGGAQIVEGTRNAAKAAPRGILVCVGGSILQGFLLIFISLFSVQDVEEILESTQPIAMLFLRATTLPISVFLMVILFVSQFGALLNNTIALSQLLWAAARDGCIPNHRYWYHLSSRRIPVRLLVLMMVVCIILIMPSFGSTVYWTAIMSTAVICINTSYGLPFFCRLIWKRNMKFEGPFSLGRWSVPLNFIAVIWIIFFSVILCIPSKYPVTAESMNWSCLMIGAVFIFSTGFWYTHGRKTYKGPIKNVPDEITPM